MCDENNDSHYKNDSEIIPAIVCYIIYFLIFETIVWLLNITNIWAYIVFLGLPFLSLISYVLQYLVNERPWKDFRLNKNFFRKLLLWLTFNFAYAYFSEIEHKIFTDYFFVDSLIDMFIRYNFFSLLCINIVCLVYLVYLFDETTHFNLFVKLGITIIYAWSFHGMYKTTDMSILSALINGTGAIIPTLFASALIEGLIFEGGLIKGVQGWVDYSRIKNKQEEIEHLENKRSQIYYDVKIDRSTKNQLLDDIRNKMEIELPTA